LNILFQIRDDYLKNLAGDTVQMLKTKYYLENTGIKVDISTSFLADLKSYDLIHLFNLIRVKETSRFVENAIRQSKKYVISTIYWNMTDYIMKDKDSPSTLEWWKKDEPLRKKAIAGASALLPNSCMEIDELKKDFEIKNDCFVIPNCSDRMFYDADGQGFTEKYGLKDFVLCVGRLSYRKNQLALINAMKRTDYKLVFIGRKSSEDYYQLCKGASNENVIFIGELKHHELISAYGAANVHVLPSWFETSGLSSLEAGLAGCNIVSTDKGCTKEYFKDMTDYCNPENVESIYSSIENAYHKPKDKTLSNYILNHYIWENAAKKTLDAYLQVLR
jgi:glycosyltransferase involved in cell wall biosynthesis